MCAGARTKIYSRVQRGKDECLSKMFQSIVVGIFQFSCLANEQIIKETAIPSVPVWLEKVV